MTTQEILKHIETSQWVDTLKTQNLDIFVVGGAVRDIVLKKNPKDIDLIVTGGISIDDLADILKEFGKVDLVGESFAVIKFKPFDLDLDEPFDIAIPRTETKTGTGHKGFEVETKNVTLADDLFRRDFSINAIAMSLDGQKFIDPLEGLDNLKSGIIKAANPAAFIDDPLRILRAIQFASRFGFDIDFTTFKLMSDNIHLLKEISGERILEEFSKIIKKQGSVAVAFRFLVECGFFKTFELKTNKHISINNGDFKTLGDFMHLLLFFEEDKHKILADRFKADNDTKKQVKALDIMHSLTRADVKPELIAASMVKITSDAFDLGTAFQCVKDILVLMQMGQLPAKVTDLEISGDDLKGLGLEGKEIGDTLQTLFEMVLFGEIPNAHSVLITVVTMSQKKWGKTIKAQITEMENQEKALVEKFDG